MKNIILICSVLFLASCGAMGIGRNRDITIRNNSDDIITASGTMGMYKIRPGEERTLTSKGEILIESKNAECGAPTIQPVLNGAAVFLDIIPGGLFGVLPIFVDAVTQNMYKMPRSYEYTCI